MSNISSLIEVFKMDMVSVESRIRIIKKLGRAINSEYSMNLTEPLVVELVLLLDPKNNIVHDEHYRRFLEEGEPS